MRGGYIVYHIFTVDDIGVSRLVMISEVLDYDFLAHYRKKTQTLAVIEIDDEVLKELAKKYKIKIHKKFAKSV